MLDGARGRQLARREQPPRVVEEHPSEAHGGPAREVAHRDWRRQQNGPEPQRDRRRRMQEVDDCERERRAADDQQPLPPRQPQVGDRRIDVPVGPMTHPFLPFLDRLPAGERREERFLCGGTGAREARACDGAGRGGRSEAGRGAAERESLRRASRPRGWAVALRWARADLAPPGSAFPLAGTGAAGAFTRWEGA